MVVYLDNSATTKPYREVTEEMLRHLEEDYGNPSSMHRMGIAAEKAIKQARKSVAALLGAKDEEICFTSGGTEADNMALLGAASSRRRRGNKIITTVIEHPAIMESCKKLEEMGFRLVYLPVEQNGQIEMQTLKDALDEQTILITIMHVNNETGSVQPLPDIGELKNHVNKKFGTEILLHTDAVQSYGKMKIPMTEIDLLSVSGHKIHGPKGSGALYIRKGLNFQPFLLGGGQERGLRSGTENVPAIAGFGTAADLNRNYFDKRIESLKKVKTYLSEGIRTEIPDIRFNSPENGSPAILNVSFLGVRGEVLLHTLEQSDIYVSTGSACSSKKRGQSHVLKAMGLTDKEVEGAIRFSFSEFNTAEEMDFVLEQLKTAVRKFRKLGSFR